MARNFQPITGSAFENSIRSFFFALALFQFSTRAVTGRFSGHILPYGLQNLKSFESL